MLNKDDYSFLKPGEFIYVNNPNWMQDGQPQRFQITNTGASIYIKPEW